MRTFIYVVLISTTLATGLAPAARADFETGREAYFTKDYAKALEELAPLAEQGHRAIWPRCIKWGWLSLRIWRKHSFCIHQQHKRAMYWHKAVLVGFFWETKALQGIMR